MKVIVTIAVRNPEWYWPKEDVRRSEGYHKEWQALNKGKVPKHSHGDSFQIGFPVLDIREKPGRAFVVPMNHIETGQALEHTLQGVKVVEFIGETETFSVFVSESLVHECIEREQHDKRYIYIYLKENQPYERLNHYIWLLEEHMLELDQAAYTEADG